MRQRAKQALKSIHLDGVARASLHGSQRLLWHFRKKLGQTDKGIVDRYLARHKVRKLQIGCGDNLHDGWLNADLFPRSASVIHLDATALFPFGDESFDYVFSEHMIEHVPYEQGLRMLSECHRVLKRGGKIR